MQIVVCFATFIKSEEKKAPTLAKSMCEWLAFLIVNECFDRLIKCFIWIVLFVICSFVLFIYYFFFVSFRQAFSVDRHLRHSRFFDRIMMTLKVKRRTTRARNTLSCRDTLRFYCTICSIAVRYHKTTKTTDMYPVACLFAPLKKEILCAYDLKWIFAYSKKVHFWYSCMLYAFTQPRLLTMCAFNIDSVSIWLRGRFQFISSFFFFVYFLLFILTYDFVYLCFFFHSFSLLLVFQGARFQTEIEKRRFKTWTQITILKLPYTYGRIYTQYRLYPEHILTIIIQRKNLWYVYKFLGWCLLFACYLVICLLCLSSLCHCC